MRWNCLSIPTVEVWEWINNFILHFSGHVITYPCLFIPAKWVPGPWFNIKMFSYQYRKSHCGDKTVVRSSYLHNGISYTGKITSLYWIRALVCQFANGLTPLPLDKMATILQTIFSDAFSWMKNVVFWLKFHWSLFLRVQLTITQHWVR